MDFGINSVIQTLLGEDEGQYCKCLFALGERLGKDSRDKDVELTDSNESDSDEYRQDMQDRQSCIGNLWSCKIGNPYRGGSHSPPPPGAISTWSLVVLPASDRVEMSPSVPPLHTQVLYVQHPVLDVAIGSSRNYCTADCSMQQL